tara:strand:- start:78 stop:224 length:147 start_codon:yes stop_codon:yes gene_type:complete
LADEGKHHITTQLEWVDEELTLAALSTHTEHGKIDNSPDIGDYHFLGN